MKWLRFGVLLPSALFKAAAGEVTAFVDNADPRSVFRRMELPNILENPRLTTINGIDKLEFAGKFK